MESKYTVYVLKCLSTGRYIMGVTPNLREHFREVRQCGGWRRHLAHPEVIHLEQHDDMQTAQQRLQFIRVRWRRDRDWDMLANLGPTLLPSMLPRMHGVH